MESKLVTPTGMQLRYKNLMSFVVVLISRVTKVLWPWRLQTFFLEFFDHRLSGCRSYLSLEYVCCYAARQNDILDECQICNQAENSDKVVNLTQLDRANRKRA